jgi:HK97 family phage major capsid protein
MSESNTLVEKRQEFAAKQKELAEVFAIAKDGDVYDLSRKAALEKLGATDSGDAVAKIKQRNIELEAMSKSLEKAELDEVKSAINSREAARSQPTSAGYQPHPAEMKARSFGEMVTGSAEYAEFKKAGCRTGHHASVDVDISIKTLMETTNGWAPESVRTGLLVEAVTRPIQILDLIPTRPMLQNSDKYMEETTRTHNAAEKSEGVAYAESVFVWTERTQAVEKITDSLPVTDEQLEDVGQLSSVIDQRLRFGLRQRLELQVLVGDGTAPNLSGILDRATQTQAKGADPIFDAVFKALTKVRFTGRAIPNALVFHPNDWQDVRLTRTADGEYIMGNPATPGPMALFGLPVSLSDALTENTGLVGDFANFCYIGERRGIQVLVGYVGDQFKEGKRTIRADLRACFTVTRPAAFCTVTGI